MKTTPYPQQLEAPARIAPRPSPTEPVDIEALRALTDSMPLQEESGGAFIRRMRDEDRY